MLFFVFVLLQEDEKENWLGDDGWNRKPETEISERESASEDLIPPDVRKEESLLWAPNNNFLPSQVGLQHGEMKDPEVQVDILPTTCYPVPRSSSVVGTIGSHPNPIISCTTDQTHCHQHQDLSTQQSSFPSTVFNFRQHSIDPACYTEYLDEWNSNIAALCGNSGTEGTPILYPDALQFNSGSLQTQQQPTGMLPPESRFVGYANYGRQQSNLTTDSASTGAVEEVNTLSTFLSKFDDKVAAIWGQQGRSAQGAGINSYLSVDGSISASSTPMGSNPWGSPSSDISTMHGVPPPSGHHHHDCRHLQPQSKQFSFGPDGILSSGYGFQHIQEQCYHQHRDKKVYHQNDNRITLGDLTISPPKGNYNIMHSMKQYFGTAPPEGEYHIIKKCEATSSAEELEISLARINHDRNTGGFVEFKRLEKSITDDENVSSGDTGNTEGLDGLDLETNDADEWEIVEACNKERAHGYDSEDLLNSWKTHFRTVPQVEAIASARGLDLLDSPITTLSSHQINPNLPEYRLFGMDTDAEYKIFNRPGQTLFPVKYKVCRGNEKGSQTEDVGAVVNFPSVESSNYFNQLAADWSKYMSAPPFEFSPRTNTNPAPTTPMAGETSRTTFDGEETTGEEVQPTTDWYNVSFFFQNVISLSGLCYDA